MRPTHFMACVTLLVWQPCCTGRFVEGDKLLRAALADSGTEDMIKNDDAAFGYDYAGAYGPTGRQYRIIKYPFHILMEDNCNKTFFPYILELPNSVGVVSFLFNRVPSSMSNYYLNHFFDDCFIDIEAPIYHHVNVVFYYVYITGSCIENYVEIQEITDDFKISRRICGKPGYIFLSKQNGQYVHSSDLSRRLRINFHYKPQPINFNDDAAVNFLGNTNERVEKGFKLIYTIYNMTDSTGSCGSTNLFRCANDHCIWKHLLCDGWNNCGDGSDEFPYNRKCPIVIPTSPLSKKPRQSIGTYIGIVVGSLFLFVACVLVILPGQRRLRFCGGDRSRNRRANSSARRTRYRNRSRRRRESNISTISGSDTFFLSSQNSSASYDNPSYEAEMPPSYDEAIRTAPMTMTSPFSFNTSDPPPRPEPTPTSQCSVITCNQHRTTNTPQDCASSVPSFPTQPNNDAK